MSGKERDDLWMACLDGELSASEAAAFDASLIPAERDRIEKEQRLERALADRLAGGECCPELVWKRVHSLVQQKNTNIRGWRALRTATAAAAAAAAIMVAYSVLRPAGAQDFTVMAATSVDELESLCAHEVPADEQNVGSFLAERGIPLEMADLNAWNRSHRHKVDLLGVHECRYQGEPVIEILFACCRQPAKVVLVRADGVAAAHLREAAGKDGTHVKVARVMGDRLAGVISRHHAEEFLDVLHLATEQFVREQVQHQTNEPLA